MKGLGVPKKSLEVILVRNKEDQRGGGSEILIDGFIELPVGTYGIFPVIITRESVCSFATEMQCRMHAGDKVGPTSLLQRIWHHYVFNFMLTKSDFKSHMKGKEDIIEIINQ